MTPMPASPFISNPVDGSPPSPTGPAVAPSPGKGDAAAGTISPGDFLGSLPSGESDPSVMLDWAPGENLPSMANGGDPGAPASAPTKNPDVGALGTDCIGEIFFYARKLMTGEIPAFVLDEAAFMADVEEIPLFIREDGYLRRQA